MQKADPKVETVRLAIRMYASYRLLSGHSIKCKTSLIDPCYWRYGEPLAGIRTDYDPGPFVYNSAWSLGEFCILDTETFRKWVSENPDKLAMEKSRGELRPIPLRSPKTRGHRFSYVSLDIIRTEPSCGLVEPIVSLSWEELSAILPPHRSRKSVIGV